MKVNKLEREGNWVTLEIEEDLAAVTQIKEEVVAEVNNEARLPGFRPGKVPPAVLEKRLGKEYFDEKTLDRVLNKTYFQAVSEKNLEPVDYPQDLKIIQKDPQKPLIYSLRVEVKPQINLTPQIYKGVAVSVKKQVVTDEEAAKALENIQKNFTDYEPAPEGAVNFGDLVRLEMKATSAQEIIPEWTHPSAGLKIGDAVILKEFDEQLLGLKTEQEKTFSLEFSTQYPLQKAAGQKVEFWVKIKEIRSARLPELNDDLAKRVGPFETLDALKKAIREDLENRAQENNQFLAGQEIIKEIGGKIGLTVPPAMVKRRVDFHKNQLEKDLSRSNLKFADYLKYVAKSEEQYLAELTRQAEEEIKTDLILEAVAKLENFEVTREEEAREIFNVAQNTGQDPLKLNETLDKNALENIRSFVLLRKTIDFLVSQAHVEYL